MPYRLPRLRHRGSCPAELLNDGDLVLLIDWPLELRERDTVRVTKVQGHADVGKYG